MWRRIRPGKGQGETVGARGKAILYRMVREDHFQEVTFQQRPEGGEGGRQADTWGKSVQAEGAASAKALRQKQGCQG